ncbi:MAG TPA: DUF4340 domain-containing protein, partial [Candidatus Limiplasma sp.]|nr:DUF4340 domain-containing protein [Candidatus Limiplasma sp.]
MKKGKRLLLLLAVVAVFGVGAYLLNLSTQQQEAAKEAAKESAKTTLLSANADDVTGLSYTNGDQTIELAKKDGQWVYAPRESFALNTSKVDTMLSDLKTVESVRTVTDTDTSAADYGLSAPAIVISVTNQDGTTQKLSIGDKNATNGNYYAAVEGKAGVYTISSDLYNAFDVPLMSLLTDEAFPTVAEDTVTGLEWSTQSDAKTLTHLADGDASAYSSAFKWFSQKTDGTVSPVNADAVSTLLSSATGITYQGTAADTKEDLATYGLDHPQLTLTLHYTEQVPESQADAAKAEEAASLATPIPTVKPTASPEATATATPEATATVTASATPDATATATASATASATATAGATPTVSATAKVTEAQTASATDTATVTATPTAALSGALRVASAEDASAVPTETPTAAPTATPEPTVPVERTLTLWFGSADESGNVYITHSKTDRIFTVSADTLTALQKLTDDDLRLKQITDLSLSDITGMNATMGGVTKAVTSSTQAVTAQNGEQTTQVLYQVDGKDLKTTL